MNKNYTAEECERILKLTHKTGITSLINLIVGFPGEEEAEFQETLKFIEKNHRYIDIAASVATLHLTSGSDVHVNCSNYGIVTSGSKWRYRWHTLDGNNYERRKDRLKKLVYLLSSYGKTIDFINLYEEHIEAQRKKFKIYN